MSGLKCCPFCSSNNIKVGSVGTSLGIDNYIKCVDCGAKIQICDGYGMEHLEKLWNRRTPMSNIVEKLEEKTEFLKDCTKYGNESPEQQEKSYSTMMMYEVADLVDELIDIVKQEISNGENNT